MVERSAARTMIVTIKNMHTYTHIILSPSAADGEGAVTQAPVHP